MMSNQPLSTIIRVAGDHEAAPGGHRLVRVTAEGKVAKGLLGPVKTKTRYIVKPDKEIELTGLQVKIRDFTNDRRIEVSFRCRVSIPSDQVDTAVESLWDWNKHVADIFYEKIQTVFKDWWEETSFRRRTTLEAAVAECRDEISVRLANYWSTRGLKTIFVLEVDEVPPSELEIETADFPVRVMDFADYALTLSVEVELVVSSTDGPLSRKQPATKEEWKVMIRDWSRRIFQEKISLHQYYGDRNAVEKIVRGELDKELARYARKCGWLKCITSKPDFDDKRFRDVTVKWLALSGRELEFVFRVDAQVIPGQEQVYARAGKPDIEKWLTDTLDTATRESLFDKEFTYLKPSTYEAFQNRVASLARERAEEIGLGMRMLVLKSRPPEWAYLEPFAVELTKQSYGTADAVFDAEFDVITTARFNDLVHVKDLLWPDDKLKQEIALYARRAAAEVMLDTQPRSYLAEFQASGLEGETTPERGWVADRLIDRVRERVSARFQPVEVIEIVIRRVDRKLQEVLERFQSAKDHFVDFAVEPAGRRTSLDNRKVDLGLRLTFVQPADMIMLATKAITPEEVWKTVEAWCTAELNRIPADVYEDVDPDHPGFPQDREHRLHQGGARSRLAAALTRLCSLNYGIGLEVIHFHLRESDAQDLDRAREELPALELYAKLKEQRARIAHNSREVESSLQHDEKLTAIDRQAEEDHRKAIGDMRTENVEKASYLGFEEGQKQLAATVERDKQPLLTDKTGKPAGAPKEPEDTPASKDAF